MTGRVDILWRIFDKMTKVKNEVTGTEKRHIWEITLKTLKNCAF